MPGTWKRSGWISKLKIPLQGAIDDETDDKAAGAAPDLRVAAADGAGGSAAVICKMFRIVDFSVIFKFFQIHGKIGFAAFDAEKLQMAQIKHPERIVIFSLCTPFDIMETGIFDKLFIFDAVEGMPDLFEQIPVISAHENGAVKLCFCRP